MFNNDTHLISEAYSNHVVKEGKMKELHMSIESGMEVEEICKEMGVECTPEIEQFITDLRNDYFEKGERDQIEDGEDCPHSSEEEPEAEDAEKKTVTIPVEHIVDGKLNCGCGKSPCATYGDMGAKCNDEDYEEPSTKHYVNF